MKSGLFLIINIIASVVIMNAVVFAAPIGVPGATTGTNQSTIGVELNLLIDRNLDQVGDTEGTTVFAKGQVGVNERVDLLYRIGFGRFESEGKDSDIGPAFGFGTKVTWAAIDDINLKIGSVFQVSQVRADVDGKGRQSFKEYDFALGAYIDAGKSNASGNRSVLTTYGGLVFSGVDIDGRNIMSAQEDNSVGLFAGLLMKMNKKAEVGVEIRLLEQTALAIYTSFAF